MTRESETALSGTHPESQMLTNPLEALARAYDREDASQRGEPTPWDDVEDLTWRAERIACAEVGWRAYLSAIHSQEAAPSEEPRAWQYELANYINPDRSYTGWDRHPRLSFEKPEVPEGSIRNLVPLFASPAPVAVAPVGVKALEWQKKPNSEEEFADTICGRYEVGIVGGGYIATIRLINEGQWDDNVFAQGICAKKAAKAAAQADFNARILSSIIPAAKPAMGVVEALTEMLERERRRYDSTPEAQEFFRRNNAAALAALSGGIETPTQAVETTYDLVNKLRSRWGFGPHCRDTLPIEWQKGLDDAADALAALHLEVGQQRLQKNKLVLAAYPAMDAIDAIRKWCDEQPYANDTITVSRLRDKLPTSGGIETPKPEGAMLAALREANAFILAPAKT